MAEKEKLKPGDYPMPDGRTNHVLEVHDLSIPCGAIFNRELLKAAGILRIKNAEKEKQNGQINP
jgi:hypothetical protein